MKPKLNWMAMIVGGLLLTSCGIFWGQSGFNNGSRLDGPANVENGERIYFRATSMRGTEISYRGGSNFGGMMMGNSYTCESCHGPAAQGGVHTMHMQVMDAPAITYAALSGESGEHEDEHDDEHSEYSLEDFRRAVIEGEHPDGESLSRDMPRWQMSDEDLADLMEFLKTIE